MRRLSLALKKYVWLRQYCIAALFHLIVITYFIVITQTLLQFNVLSYSSLAAPIAIPNEFHRILSGIGVEVYQRNYPNASPDFITVVNLRTATIRNLTGAVTHESITRKPLDRFWQDAIDQNIGSFKARVVLNGTFFGNNHDKTTEIAFGLKTKGNLINYGYGLDEYPGLNKTFAFDSFAANAQIQPYRSTTFDIFPDVIGALAAQADKSASRRLGRTFVGAVDTNYDFVSDTILFFSSVAATQAHAETVLKRLGATEIAMLDGGGSTNLIVDGTAYIKTDRTLPHAIAIYADKPEAPILGIEGKCLDVNDRGIFDRAQVQLSRCNDSAAQRWSFKEGALQGMKGQCLDAIDQNQQADTSVQFLTCNGGKTQYWLFEKGSFKASGDRCLEAISSSADENFQVQLRPCTESAAQRWQRID